MINVIIAEDHPITRVGISRMIQACESTNVIGEAENTNALLKMVRRVNKKSNKKVVVLLDLVMPSEGGLWAIQRIKEVSKKIKVVVLSAKTDKQTILTAIKFGADGYVIKESDTDQIIEAVQAVARDEYYYSKNITATMFSPTEKVNLEKDRLSKREIQTLALASEGHSLTEIAEILKLSVKTVGTYKSRIYKKLKIGNINELIKFALVNNIKSESFIDGINRNSKSN